MPGPVSRLQTPLPLPFKNHGNAYATCVPSIINEQGATAILARAYTAKANT